MRVATHDPAHQALVPTSARVWRTFSSRPERVFDAFLDPAMIRAWCSDRHVDVVRVEVQPHPHGTFSIVQRRRDGTEREMFGDYRELHRPHRLVFTWATPAADLPEGVVTIELEPDDTGSAITLTHQVHPSWAGRTAEIEAGWTRMLDAMADALGYPACDDPSINAPSM